MTPSRSSPVRRRLAVGLFFLALVLAGVVLHTDYGLSWDDCYQREDNGYMYLRYIRSGDPAELRHARERFHGPAFELALIGVEKALGLTDPRRIYFARHLATFLAFVLGAYTLYRIGVRQAGRWGWALLAAGILVFSPRMFAEAFYNSKDIAFLAFFVVAVYTLLVLLERRTAAAAAVHGLACGWLIAIRITGVLVPALTAGFLVFEWLWGDPVRGWGGGAGRRRRAFAREVALPLAVALVATAAAAILFWPTLWQSPWHDFRKAFEDMSRFEWDRDVLYLGRYVNALHVPWHYLPVWIAVSTPLPWLGFAAAGAGAVAAGLRAGLPAWYRRYRVDALALAWLALPIFAIIALHSVVYDSWRHVFFVYPALVLLAVRGVMALDGAAGLLPAGAHRAAGRGLLAAAVAVTFGWTAVRMARLHPYENVYFNRLAGPDLGAIGQRFDLDYWGLSFRRGFEYVLAHDDARVVPVYVSNKAGAFTPAILPAADRARLHYSRRIEDARYFLTDFRWHHDRYPYTNEVFAVRREGGTLLAVYRLP